MGPLNELHYVANGTMKYQISREKKWRCLPKIPLDVKNIPIVPKTWEYS